MKIQYINEWIDTEEIEDDILSDDDEVISKTIAKSAEDALSKHILNYINPDNIVEQIHFFEKGDKNNYVAAYPSISPKHLIVGYNEYIKPNNSLDFYKSLINIHTENKTIYIDLPYNFLNGNEQYKAIHASFIYDIHFTEILEIAVSTLNCIEHLYTYFNDILKNTKLLNNYKIEFRLKLVWITDLNLYYKEIYDFSNMRLIISYKDIIRMNKNISVGYLMSCLNTVLDKSINIHKKFKIHEIYLRNCAIKKSTQISLSDDIRSKIGVDHAAVGHDINLDIFEKLQLDLIFDKVSVDTFLIEYHSAIYSNADEIISDIKSIKGIPNKTVIKYRMPFNVPSAELWDIRDDDEMEAFLDSTVKYSYSVINMFYYSQKCNKTIMPYQTFKKLYYSLWDYRNWFYPAGPYKYPGMLFKYNLNEPLNVFIYLNLEDNTISYYLDNRNLNNNIKYVGPKISGQTYNDENILLKISKLK